MVLHVYSKEPVVPNTRDFQFEVVDQLWLEEGPFGPLDQYVSEWNQSGSSGAFDREEDYGLYHAQEMLNVVEAFSYWGVDRAAVWPLVQNTPNALSTGWDYDTLSPDRRIRRRHRPSRGR